MVRDQAISPDARQLAARLGITALTEADVTRLEELLQTDTPLDATPLALLFDSEAVASAMSNFGGMDRRLKPLLDYRQFDYWVHDDHFNLVGLPDTLIELRAVLAPSNPNHVGLVLAFPGLSLPSLARCVGTLPPSHVSQPHFGSNEDLVGGPS